MIRAVRSRLSTGLRAATALLASLFAGIGMAGASADGDQPVLVAYVPVWGVERVAALDLRGAGLTHLVYAFVKPVYDAESGSVEILLDFPGNGAGEGRSGGDALRAFREIAEKNGLRKLVSFGGWGSSEYFSDIAADESARRLFAEKARAFVLEHDLDGIDLDWEYPLEGGAEGTAYRSDDPANLVKLAHAVRRAFETHPEARDKILTVAIPGSYEPLSTRYRLRPLAKQVDWFHLMAYDFAGPWLAGVGHNAPLLAPGHPPYRSPSVSGALASLRALGVPPGKTVLGLSLSGVRFEGVRIDSETVKGASYEVVDQEAARDGWNDYRYLIPRVFYPLDVMDWAVVEDFASEADFLVSESAGTAISFESRRAAAAKARFARKQGLRGLMFWSLDKDGDAVPLIREANAAFGGEDR